MAFAHAKRAQPVEPGARGVRLMNPVQNKYFGDQAAPAYACCDRWTLVVSSDPALLATLHWMADDHFVGPKLEPALSGVLHDAALI